MNDLVPCCEKVFRFVSTLWRCLLVFKNIRVDCWSPNVCLCGNTEGICIAMRWGYGRQWEIAQGIKTARTLSQQPKQESSRWLKYTGPNLRIPDSNIDVVSVAKQTWMVKDGLEEVGLWSVLMSEEAVWLLLLSPVRSIRIELSGESVWRFIDRDFCGLSPTPTHKTKWSQCARNYVCLMCFACYRVGHPRPSACCRVSKVLLVCSHDRSFKWHRWRLP